MSARGLHKRLDRAEDLYRGGDVNGAMAVAEAVAQDATSLLPSECALVLARCGEMRAVALQDHGRDEDALQALAQAETSLDGFPEHRVFLGRLQLSIAQVCARLGFLSDSERYRALALQNTAGSKYEAYARAAFQWQGFDLGPIQDESVPWRVRVERCEQMLDELATHESTPRLSFTSLLSRRKRSEAQVTTDIHGRVSLAVMGLMLGLFIQYGDQPERRHGLDGLTDLVLIIGEDMKDAALFLQETAAYFFLVDDPEFDLGPRLTRVTQLAFQFATMLQAEEMAARAHLLAALDSRRLGDARGALGHALTSLALDLSGILRTESSVVRAGHSEELNQLRDFALTLAIERGDSALAAELIETHRIQADPALAERLSSSDAIPRSFREILSTSRAGFGRAVNVTVNGFSHLAGRAATVVEAEGFVSLEDAITWTGGAEAYWWGAFVRLGRIHWVLRDPLGSLECGTRVLTEEDKAALWRVERDAQMMSGQIMEVPWSDPEDELALMSALGKALIPWPLAVALTDTATPLQLCISSNFLSMMPLPGIGVPNGNGVRLVERSVIRIQPPAFLVRRAVELRQKTDSSRKFPVLLACSDPSGNLKNAHFDRLDPLVHLSNESDDPNPDTWATRANVVSFLSRLAPGAPGIFFFTGHVDPRGGDIHSCLVLVHDEVVSAGDWLGAYGEPPLPTPARVVISACASSGASGSGAGEWFGLAAGFLASGGQQVIATSWPLLDLPFTGRFDEDIVSQLQRAEDPAEVLAATQRASLATWRKSNPDHLDRPYPIIWTAYQCIGLLHTPPPLRAVP